MLTTQRYTALFAPKTKFPLAFLSECFYERFYHFSFTEGFYCFFFRSESGQRESSANFRETALKFDLGSSESGTPTRKLTTRARKSVKKGTNFRSDDGGGGNGGEAGRVEGRDPSSEKI